MMSLRSQITLPSLWNMSTRQRLVASISTITKPRLPESFLYTRSPYTSSQRAFSQGNVIRGHATTSTVKSLSPVSPALTQTGTSLTIVHPSFPHGSYSFPYIWLRDSCMCPSCIHPSTRQKLHRTSDIPLDIVPRSIELGRSKNEWVVKIMWNKDIYRHDTSSTGIEGHGYQEECEAHVSEFGLEFLVLHSSSTKLRDLHHADALEPRAWMKADLVSRVDSSNRQSNSLFIPYADLRSSREILCQALTQLVKYGVTVITGVPTTIPETAPPSVADWELRHLANIFSHIRETFYGDLWDVKSLPKDETKNIAYTDLDLDLHMDLLYFESPPRYQLLHCLRNRNVIGGESIFVDALQASQTLYLEDRASFEVLRATDVGFWYLNDGHHYQRQHKTIVVEEDSSLDQSSGLPRITAINYSPPFQSPLSLSTTPPEFYPALQKFSALLRRPEARWEYLMKEGDVIVFDNRRVLHARRSFVDHGSNAGAESNRWLKGCYVEADAVKDRLRILRTELGLVD